MGSSRIAFFLGILIWTGGVSARSTNPDGSVKIIPYNGRQEALLEVYTREIDQYYKDIEELIPFLNYEKKIRDAKYIQASYAREYQEPGQRHQYLINSRYTLQIKSGGEKGFTLEGVDYWSRKALLTKHYNPVATYRELTNKIGGKNLENLSLLVREVDNGGERKMTYSLASIEEPKARLDLVRAYRDRLAETKRTIQRYINTRGTQAERDVYETIKEVRYGGDFQEPNRQ